MRNATRFILAIVVGLILLIFGILNQAQVLGYHPTRAIVGIIVGAILLLVGIVGMVVGRRGGPA